MFWKKLNTGGLWPISWLKKQLPDLGFFTSFNSLNSGVIPHLSLSLSLLLRSFPPLTSPLPPSLPLQMLLSLQMLFGALTPVHIHSYHSSSSSLLHRCCLAHVFLSFFSSPLPLFTPPLLSLTLAVPCTLRQILFVSPSALSPNFPSSLHPLFVPSFPHISQYTHPRHKNLHFPLVFISSVHFLAPHPCSSISPLSSPRCFLDSLNLSCRDNETEKYPAAKQVLVVLGCRGRVTVICSQPR